MRQFAQLLPFLATLLLSGCQQDPDPGQVSEAFWTAVQQQRVDAVEKLIAPNTRSHPADSDDLLAIDGFTLGRIIIDDAQATVETEISVAADKPLTVPLETHLIRHQNRWLVDYDATVAGIRSGGELAQLLGQLRGLGQQLGAQVDQSIEELEQHLPEMQRQLQRFEEQIREAMPELRQQLEEFSRKLEESLQDFGRPPAESAPDNQGQAI